MRDFHLDETAVEGLLRAARRPRSEVELLGALDRSLAGEGLEPLEMAQLWFADTIPTDTLYELACTARARRPFALETFSPLYMTNTCDAACRMCGMRSDNGALRRETAPAIV